MNKEIQELLQSENKEDMFLGIEMLYRTDPSYFKREHPKSKWFMDGYVPVPLCHYLYKNTDTLAVHDKFPDVFDYCEQNNYWIYAAESE